MALLGVFSAILLMSFLATVRSQQSIEFLFDNDDPPGQGVRYTTNLPTVPAIAKRCNKVCFSGMWAMYTSTYYGAGNPNVTVYPAQGCSLRSCFTSMGLITSKINSFRQLAAPPTAVPVPGTGMEFWRIPYFIGASETAVPASPAMIKSFAINSFLMPKAYVICNAAGLCACCDTLNGHYLVPDISGWPNAENPLGDVASFTEVASSADAVCANALYQPLE